MPAQSSTYIIEVKTTKDDLAIVSVSKSLDELGEHAKTAHHKTEDGAKKSELSHKQLKLAIRSLGPEFEALIRIVEADGLVWLGGLTLISSAIVKINGEVSEARDNYIKAREAMRESDEAWAAARRQIEKDQIDNAVEWQIHQRRMLDNVNKTTEAYDRQKSMIALLATEQAGLIDSLEKAEEIIVKLKGATPDNLEDMQIKAERAKQEEADGRQSLDIANTRQAAGKHLAAAKDQEPVIQGLREARDQADAAAIASKEAVDHLKSNWDERQKHADNMAADFATAQAVASTASQAQIPGAAGLQAAADALGKYAAIAADVAKSAKDAYESKIKEAALNDGRLEVVKSDLEAAIKKRDTEDETARTMREQADTQEQSLATHKTFQAQQNAAQDDAIRAKRRAALDAHDATLANEPINQARQDITHATQTAHNILNNHADAHNHIPELVDVIKSLNALYLNTHASPADQTAILTEIVKLKATVFELARRAHESIDQLKQLQTQLNNGFGDVRF